MSKADDGLRAILQKFLPKPDWDWTVIETGSTHQGVPDSYYTHRDREVIDYSLMDPKVAAQLRGIPGRPDGWVECKATDGWAVKVEPHQVRWLKRHAAAGVRCTLAVRARGVHSSRGTGDSLWVVQGGAAEYLQAEGLQLDPSHVLGAWFGPPESWDWRAVGSLLLR